MGILIDTSWFSDEMPTVDFALLLLQESRRWMDKVMEGPTAPFGPNLTMYYGNKGQWAWLYQAINNTATRRDRDEMVEVATVESLRNLLAHYSSRYELYREQSFVPYGESIAYLRVRVKVIDDQGQIPVAFVQELQEVFGNLIITEEQMRSLDPAPFSRLREYALSKALDEMPVTFYTDAQRQAVKGRLATMGVWDIENDGPQFTLADVLEGVKRAGYYAVLNPQDQRWVLVAP